MTNINLSQSVAPKKISGGGNRIMDKGTIISLVVLILTGLAWGGVHLYALDVKQKIVTTTDEITSEEQKIDGKDVRRIADFQNRLAAVEESLNAQNKPNDALSKISSALLEKSYITSFNYDTANQTVALSVVSDGIADVAKQTLNFKESPYFSAVDALGDYAENEKKEVFYEAELILSAKELEAGE